MLPAGVNRKPNSFNVVDEDGEEEEEALPSVVSSIIGFSEALMLLCFSG